MRQTVSDVFPTFSTIFEGRVAWMYLDVKGLVTTGVGDLIDPMSEAQQYPWEKPDGSPASDAEIALEWQLVKSRTDLAPHGGGTFGSITKLRLSQATIDEMVRGKLSQMDAYFAKRLPAGLWETLCADAQLGCLSMCWAMGPAFQYPRFLADLAEGTFAVYTMVEPLDGTEPVPVLSGGCAYECFIPDAKNPGLIPRNKVNQQLFEAAQRVSDQGLDTSALHYKDT